ncbi:hypothetical protein, partial [Tropicimonas sp. IMCC6043]
SDSVADLAKRIRTDGIDVAATLIAGGALDRGRIAISLDAAALADATGLPTSSMDPDLLELDRPFTCRRRGAEMKIVAGSRAPEP